MKKYPRYIRIAAAAVSILLSTASFVFMHRLTAGWLSLQAGPYIVKLFASFTASSLAILLALLLFAFLFGRFYCAVLCPLGILQDITGSILPEKIKRKNAGAGNYPKLRYALAVIAFGTLIGGSAAVFSLIDPYSNFGRMVTGLLTPLLITLYNIPAPYGTFPQIINDTAWTVFGAGLPFVILTGLVVWKRRIFCTAVCPVGTLFGLCAKKGIFRLAVNPEKCISCMRCMNVCPAGCIDIKNGKNIDNERCVRCMNCMAFCPAGAIGFTAGKKENTVPPGTPGRRNFIKGGILAAAALGFGRMLKIAGRTGEAETGASLVCPPGAGSPERFLSKCTNCNLCITGCLGHVLRPATPGKRAVHLDFHQGVCEFSCNKCTEMCPTGALRPMGLREKQRWRIGLADLDLPKCITVTDGTDCGACAEVCPTAALYMVQEPDGRRLPHFKPDLCIGCGSCEHACPVRPVRAVIVHPVSIQVQADDPKAEFGKKTLRNDNGENIIKTDEWLF